MLQVTEAEVFRACRTLFGPEPNLNQEFLAYLQPAGVRSAYRRKAKVIHPDRFAVSSSSIQARQHRLFQDLNQAHQTVQTYLKQRRSMPQASTARAHSAARSAPPRQHQEPPQWRPQKTLLPARPLQFGLFLYYLKLVPFNALIAAIVWQRQQRPMIGEIARRWGWLNDREIRTILQNRRGIARFGERAEQLGILSSRQVRTLLYFQRSKQQQLGRYFVEEGFFDEATLQDLLQQLAEHNRTYGRGFSDQFYYYHRQ